MTIQPISTVKIFYCHAPEDDELQAELQAHLRSLRIIRHITTWFDRDISAGADREKEIEVHLDAANIVLILVSADFFVSDYWYNVAMVRALKRHQMGTACVIPIILRPVLWEDTPIGTLPVLPSGKKAVTLWTNRDEAWQNVAQGVREVVRGMLSTQVLSPQESDILSPRQSNQPGQSPVLPPSVYSPQENRVLSPAPPDSLEQSPTPVVLPPSLMPSAKKTRVLPPTPTDRQRQAPTIFRPKASFRVAITKSSQNPTALLHRLNLKPPKRLYSVTILIIFVLFLLIGGSIGIYRVVADLRNPSLGSSTPASTVPTNPGVPGYVWHTQRSSTIRDLAGVVWLDHQFVAVGGNGTILTSPDGNTWTPRSDGIYGSTSAFAAVAWSGSQFVVVGPNGALMTSSNGNTWIPQQPPTGAWLNGVTSSGSLFVTVGNNGTILTSSNGSTWTTQNSTTSIRLTGIAWSGSQFVAVGGDEGWVGNGIILTSSNGNTWRIPQNVGTFADLTSVAWLDHQFVAVGGNGTILTSPDGSIWTSHTNSAKANFYGVAWSGHQFVVVGDNGGTILTSPDGSTWAHQISDMTPSYSGAQDDVLVGVAWSGSQFVAVGDNGIILTSP